jgi:1-acyl-sn-glycerol-3-phosphate acyltransferase
LRPALESPSDRLSQRRPIIPDPPGRLKYNFIRIGLRMFINCYLRVRLEGVARLPQAPYLLTFSHPNWVDPMAVVAFWPDSTRISILGPKEEDMRIGWRNQLIGWTRMAVPFTPSKRGLLETTRHATAVLKRGDILAVAGEGRLSDDEGRLAPLEEGPAYIALRARMPIVPLAVIGTRWLRFGKRVTLRIGEPLSNEDRRPDRAGVAGLTAELQAAMEGLLEGVVPEPPPGRFGRWFTDVFNERPWLDEQRSGGANARGPD